MISLALKSIPVGEPDANAEYFLAKKEKRDPIFIEAYYEGNRAGALELKSGSKFLLFGQKGTGKTAVLRHLEGASRDSHRTRFVVFRKEILEEAELSALSVIDGTSTVVDEEEIKKTRFFYHAMKRLLLTLLLAECKDIEAPPEELGWFSKLYSDLKTSSAGEIAALIADSIFSTLRAAKVDLQVLTRDVVSVDASKAVKRSNDAYVKYCFRQFKKHDLKARVFLDEMHFAYRDTNTLSADAALVRDTIMAVQSINERLIEEEIDSTVFMSLRSEFLEHEEIATADIAHTVQSYGHEISWEAYSYDKSHPIFDLMLARLQLSLGSDFDRASFFIRWMPDEDARLFLEYAWGKPRDIVRFFKAAKDLYPNNGSIRGKEFNAVLRKYSNLAWQDIKSALTAFVPKQAISELEHALQKLAQDNFGKKVRHDRTSVLSILEPAHTRMKGLGVTYSVEELFRLLYILGIFYIAYTDVNGQYIVHQFHRGNRRPVERGEVRLHFAVARAFS